MLEAENAKELKKMPVIEYEIPKKIFMKHDAAAGVDNALPVKLWDFS
jgi:U3 small nucleolar RNA-associated protein 19